MASDLVQRLRGIDEDKCYAHPWTVGQACNDAADRIEALEAENKALREVLKFYANSENYEGAWDHQFRTTVYQILCDGGRRARALLAKGGK